MPPHPLTKFEIQKYYQNEPRFNGVYSMNNLPKRSFTKIKDGTYIIHLVEYSEIRTHAVALYVVGVSPKDVQNDDVVYFDFFGVEHIPK